MFNESRAGTLEPDPSLRRANMGPCSAERFRLICFSCKTFKSDVEKK